ncbi:cell division protein FtsL [Xinfangfangia sp. D13-10-4-6]|uniref:cell division protein FtsL n=1 Tax=Pseudogemmobacter hezensis TaxID=2737662 RepID=UPI001553D4F4|nr:cell division protein FtsL [Pseudogemmobacter hezensis]NPD15157.1 cell division protein FtsL [Pseudogemmobacter hezensis]
MRPVLYVFTFLAVIALGFWAYRENYATQEVLREVRSLQREIAGLREGLSVQKAEWAWLNRPERLRELVSLNFERVPLLPMDPGQFGATAGVAYPPPAVPAIDAPEGLAAGLGAGLAGQIGAVQAVIASSEEGL